MLTALAVSLIAVATTGHGEILIESLESKTREGAPVFNRIQYLPGPDQDVWMMNQSHYGLNADSENWERLAIVVDKTTEPKTARFFQIEPGPLAWNAAAKRTAFRVSCFMCHNNGPRAIRPDYESKNVSLSNLDRAAILAWNLRIKTYGRIVPSREHDREDKSLAVPFRSHSKIDNDDLRVASCVKCHQEGGLFARGALKRQQAPTIAFMVESGQMPPPGFSVTADDRAKIDEFLAGF